MMEPTVTPEQREKTIDLFLNDLQTYTKRDRKHYEVSSAQSWVWYLLGVPPYPKKYERLGTHPRLESRIILFPRYLLFLTEWTPEKAAETKKMTLGSFAKDFATEGISQLTFGATDMIGAIATKAVPAKSMKLLGKNPDEMMTNPWSVIIPLEDVVRYELVKVNFTLRILYLHVNHRYEGELDIGMTYHSGGVHTRADSLYKKVRKLIGK